MNLDLLECPTEVLMYISSFLANNDLLNLGLSCKKLLNITLRTAIDRARINIPSNQAEAFDTLAYQYNIVLRKKNTLQQANAILEAVTIAIYYPQDPKQYNPKVNTALQTLTPLLSDESLGWAHYAFFALAAEANTRGAIRARSNPAFVTILSKLVETNLNNRIIPQRFLAPLLGNDGELQTQIQTFEDLNKKIVDLEKQIVKEEETFDKPLNTEIKQHSPLEIAAKTETITDLRAKVEEVSAEKNLQMLRLITLSKLQIEQLIVAARESLETRIENRDNSSYRHSTWLLMNVNAIHQAKQMNEHASNDIIENAFNEIIARTYRTIGTLAIYYHDEAHKQGIALTESTQTNFNQRHPNHAKPLFANTTLQQIPTKTPDKVTATAETTSPTSTISSLPNRIKDSKKSKFSSLKRLVTKAFS